MKPLAQSGSASRAITTAIVSSSGTSSPRSMNAFIWRPTAVPCLLISRSRSPLATCATPTRRATVPACVPFPAPGGPINTTFTGLPAFTIGLAVSLREWRVNVDAGRRAATMPPSSGACDGARVLPSVIERSLSE